MSAVPVVRPTVRVLLVDDTERVLLFASIDDDGKRFWYPAGGGIEPGETMLDAAHRELREETGLEGVAIGPEVWRRQVVVAWGGVTYDCRERYLLAWVRRFTVDTSGFTDDEHDSIVKHRWWSFDELDRADDRLVPADLAARLRDLMENGPPGEPIDLSEETAR